jgi:ketosteroid isomerase-like protein
LFLVCHANLGYGFAMQIQHAEALKQFYSHFTEGRIEKAFEGCADSVTFQIAGKSPLAGKYSRANVRDLESRLREFTQGTYSLAVHDILASDLHGTVLGTEKFTSQGKTHEFRVVHVWRFENGKPLAGYLYERDLYAFDGAF